MAVIAQARFFVGIDSMPAHVAQALGVKSAIVFGSIHPLARVWNRQTVWPLVAPLSCIGCYHVHLEPSIPFCMRRDEACMSTLSKAEVQTQFRAMVAGIEFDWSELEPRYRDLQAKFFKLMRYHPAPPERAFRKQLLSNEKISNLIYEMTEKMGDLLNAQYQTTAVNALRSRVSDLQRELFQKHSALKQAEKTLAAQKA